MEATAPASRTERRGDLAERGLRVLLELHAADGGDGPDTPGWRSCDGQGAVEVGAGVAAAERDGCRTARGHDGGAVVRVVTLRPQVVSDAHGGEAAMNNAALIDVDGDRPEHLAV